jgi:ATP-binding cassette subfamily B protein
VKAGPTQRESLRGVWRARGRFRRIAGLLAPYGSRSLLALVCAVGAAVFALTPALVLRQLVNGLERGHEPFAHTAVLLGLGLLGMLASGLLNVASTYLVLTVGKQVVAALRQELFDHLLTQSVGYFTRSRTGELLSRVLNDVGTLDGIVGTTLLTLVAAACTMAASLVLMFILSWQLSLVTLFVFPVVAVSLRVAGRPIFDRRRAVQESFARLTGQLQEILGISGILLVKSFGREGKERARFSAANDDLRQLEIRSAMSGQWISMALSLLSLLGPIALVLTGAALVADHTITLGTLIAFATVTAAGFSNALLRTANSLIAIIGSLPMWVRVFEVLDEPVDVPESPTAITPTSFLGSVTFEQVSFSYLGQRTPALNDISVAVEPGQLVALVGPSGAGKTTFSNLVPRFFDPQCGRVLIDGNDVRQLSTAWIREAVGLVLQDAFLFHTSLRENLLYGRPEATDSDLDRACQHAALSPVIASLPDGYDTLVGERGHRLSGGEKQRVAIARIILKDPSILILDEATSHLDSLSEELIQTALTELFKGRTSLVIAHRLSTVRSADLILVLDQGRIVEAGSHEELSQAGRLYTRLYETQFQST